MAVDALRGRGAYRCGCGARIHLTVPPPKPLCCGPVSEGVRCVRSVIRESAEHGFHLCRKHFDQYLEYLKRRDWYLKAIESDESLRRECRADERSRQERALESARSEGRMVVYYVRIGHYIKIGTTTSFKYRMVSLMPDEILATEPGHVELEKARLKQFAHLKIPLGRERFRPAPELLDHIKMIRAHFGPPAGRYPQKMQLTAQIDHQEV